jgi:O-antigen/teichoic acid export membrane protein
MIYCGRKQGAALEEYAGSALLHQCAVMLATSLVLAAAMALGLAPPAAAAAHWLLVLAAPLLLMREFARQMSFAHLQLGLAIVLDLAIGVFQLGAIALLAATGRLSVLAALAVMAVASGLAATAWLAVKPQACAGRLRAALRDLAANWPFARWALASQLLASTSPYVLPWVVALTHGESETGLLGACSTLVGLSNTFLMGLCNYLSPRAARAYAEAGLAALQDVLSKTGLLFGATLGTAAVAALLFGEQAAVLVYGPKFLGAGPIIAVLSLGVLANSIGVTAGNGLWAMERPSANFTADLGSLAVVLVATALLVPRFGPLGAAWATLLGTAAGAVVRVIALRRAMREHALAAPRPAGSSA